MFASARGIGRSRFGGQRAGAGHRARPRSVGSWFCRQERRAEVDRVDVDRACRPGTRPAGCSRGCPTYETSSDDAHGSVICTPACHCTEDGRPGVVLERDRAPARRTARDPVPSVCSWPLRRSCERRDRRVPGNREDRVAVRTIVEQPAAAAQDQPLRARSGRRPRRTAARPPASARCRYCRRCRRPPGGCRW